MVWEWGGRGKLKNLYIFGGGKKTHFSNEMSKKLKLRALCFKAQRRNLFLSFSVIFIWGEHSFTTNPPKVQQFYPVINVKIMTK